MQRETSIVGSNGENSALGSARDDGGKDKGSQGSFANRQQKSPDTKPMGFERLGTGTTVQGMPRSPNVKRGGGASRVEQAFMQEVANRCAQHDEQLFNLEQRYDTMRKVVEEKASREDVRKLTSDKVSREDLD